MNTYTPTPTPPKKRRKDDIAYIRYMFIYFDRKHTPLFILSKYRGIE